MVKGELSSADSQAVARMGQLVADSRLSFWTSTVMKDELDRIPEPYRQEHLDAYNALRIVAGHPTTSWIDDDPNSPTYQQQTVHLTFRKLQALLPDPDDARHLFQASANSVQDFITVDRATILNRSSQISDTVGLRVWSPADYMSNWTT